MSSFSGVIAPLKRFLAVPVDCHASTYRRTVFGSATPVGVIVPTGLSCPRFVKAVIDSNPRVPWGSARLPLPRSGVTNAATMAARSHSVLGRFA